MCESFKLHLNMSYEICDCLLHITIYTNLYAEDMCTPSPLNVSFNPGRGKREPVIWSIHNVLSYVDLPFCFPHFLLFDQQHSFMQTFVLKQALFVQDFEKIDLNQLVEFIQKALYALYGHV